MSQHITEWVVAYSKMTGADGLLRINALSVEDARKKAKQELAVRYGNQSKYMSINSVQEFDKIRRIM